MYSKMLPGEILYSSKEILKSLLDRKRELNYEVSYGDVVLQTLAELLDEPMENPDSTITHVIEQNRRIMEMLFLVACFLAGQGAIFIPKNFLESGE